MLRRRNRWLALTIAAVVAAPLVVHLALWIEHRLAFAGVCGPHATDIPAHPCTRAEYLAEFGQGFDGIGLLLVESLAVIVASVVATSGWLFAWLWGRRRR